MRAAAIYLRQATIAFDQSQPDAWTDELNIAVDLHDRISELAVIYGDDFQPCTEAHATDDTIRVTVI